MFGRIVAGVLAPVVIAASGYGGFAGMKWVVDRIELETSWEPAPQDGGVGNVVTNYAFQVRLPVPAVAEPLPAIVVNGVPVYGTMWTSEPNAYPFFLLSHIDYTPVGSVWVGDQAAMHEGLARMAESSGGTLSGETEFVVGADPARSGVVDNNGLRMYITMVTHGSMAVTIAVLTDAIAIPQSYLDAVASLQWLE